MLNVTPLTPSDDRLSEKISVLLADDHPLMRQALRMWIEKQRDLEVIAEASDGKEAIEIALKLNPKVVIMDIGMPKINGLEATKQIKSYRSNINILVITVYTDKEHILCLLRAGASGYLTKNASGDEIIHAIRSVSSGEKVFPLTDLHNFAENSNIKPTDISELENLTQREISVLKFAAKGLSNKDIAIALDLSLRSVKATFTTMFLKLGASSRTEAISMGLSTNIIGLNDFKQ